MAYTRVNKASSSGNLAPFDVIGFYTRDSSNTSITIPSDTDFLILEQLYMDYTNNLSRNLSSLSDNEFIGFVMNIGESVTVYQRYGSGTTTTSQWASIAWTNATTVSLTRQNTGGGLMIMACRFKS